MGARGVLRVIQGGLVAFMCPGCKESHVVRVEPSGGQPCWGFNGDYDRPTFTPSVLVRSGHHVSGWKEGDGCWCDDSPDGGDWGGFGCYVCHSFVTDGRIQFLSDCTHALAGQTVPLAPFGEA